MQDLRESLTAIPSMVSFELLIKPFIHWRGRIWVLTGQYELPFSYGDVTKHPFGSHRHIRYIQCENFFFFCSALHPIWGTGAPKRPKRGTSIGSDTWLLRHRGLPHVLAASPFRVMIPPSVQNRIRTGKIWKYYVIDYLTV